MQIGIARGSLAARGFTAHPSCRLAAPRQPPAHPHATAAQPYFEQGLASEHSSPITATPWISISMPGRAKLEMVSSALAG